MHTAFSSEQDDKLFLATSAWQRAHRYGKGRTDLANFQ